MTGGEEKDIKRIFATITTVSLRGMFLPFENNTVEIFLKRILYPPRYL